MFGILPPGARELFSVAVVLGPAVRRIGARVQRANADGVITSDEAAKIGGAVSREIGDIRINYRGVDVLDAKAQREILRGVARIVQASVAVARAGNATDTD